MFTLLDRRRRSPAARFAQSVARSILLAGLILPQLISAPAQASPAAAGGAASTAFAQALDQMRYRVGPEDRLRYQSLFAAADRGDWQAVDAIVPIIRDRRLVGHALAAHHLARDAHSSFADLIGWLDLYADLPEADAIYKLALVMRPVGVATALPRPRRGDAGGGGLSDTDIAGSAEPHTAAGERASNRYFSGDFAGALADATRATDALRARASTSHWIAGLAAWQLGQFADAERHFVALSQAGTASGWMLAAGAYWTGRIEERRSADTTSTQWFVKASRYRTTFYGMLAMHKLGIDIAHAISGASVTPAHLDTLAETPAGYRAVALLQLGRRDLAAQELERIDSADPRMVEALLVVADAAHLGDQSFDLAQRIAPPEGPTSISTLFPIPRWQPHGGFRIDPALVYAVARQESAFDPNAVSPAGAAGLMQLMPRTAEAVGGSSQLKSLFDPATNLDLGQRYMTALMGDPAIGENLLLLAIAYNTGTTNLAKFRHFLQSEDPLLAIESVPTDETRQFIERVLANYWIYRARLGRDTASLSDLADGRWPVYRWEDASARSVISAAARPD